MDFHPGDAAYRLRVARDGLAVDEVTALDRRSSEITHPSRLLRIRLSRFCGRLASPLDAAAGG